ncbi:dihydrofolate reductase family protein [Gulosibacter molinativorax]|uniref:Deaminase n=1 Tax=Gulosibacter molinativorax TaxID=256821 RepID=A0ABT7C5C2_9MICO|nr:dihydrofolate reductase family protein [Gulosibacter molinativorax]MDJ1370002.1 deaminase [Gulosibacter molinativorax]QUY63808.1 Putative dihydrofolate reductase [Gulosibacter molinativorax]
MRTLIITAFVSADGVMEAPGGEQGYRNSGWTFRFVKHDDKAYEIKGREENEAGALLLGRKSYEAFAPIWPEMKDFARYNTLPRYVVSRTLEQDDERWPATILRSVEDVAKLKETEGGPLLVHGSGELGAALADAGLVDRYHLLVFPLLLGSGKRLFSNAEHDATKLAVVEQEVYDNGIIKVVYDVVREPVKTE